MKCTWLGQAGLLFDFGGEKVLVDPYFSNSVSNVNPTVRRRREADMRFLEERPDVLILTHDHLDHTDPETLEILLKRWESMCVLASQNAWNKVRKYGNNHNYVMFNRHTEWTYGGIRFRAVHAQHSDDYAIGCLITYQDRTYYITGDTLYHLKVLEDIRSFGQPIEVVFLPVNGVGNNMNMEDAARFAEKIGAEKIVPIHFGLYDDLDPQKDFVCRNKIVPEVYQEILL